jgi:hypothetical protein
VFGGKKRQQEAEAAPLRAFLRLKIGAYKDEAALAAAKAEYFKEAARQDAESRSPMPDIERSIDTYIEREIEARGLFTAATSLELIVQRHVTKPDILSAIERLAAESAQDAAKLANKKAWRAETQREYGQQALVSHHTSGYLNALLAELFRAPM